MKPIVLSALLLMTGIVATAQFQKGDIYTRLNFSRQFREYNANTYQFSLEYGISKHSTLGAFYSYKTYSPVNSSSPGFVTYRSHENGVGITYAYSSFFGNSRKLGWYGNASLGYYNELSKYKYTTSEPYVESRRSYFSLQTGAGIFYKPSERFMITGGMSIFELDRTNYRGSASSPNRFNTTFVPRAQVGVVFSLGSGKKKN